MNDYAFQSQEFDLNILIAEDSNHFRDNVINLLGSYLPKSQITCVSNLPKLIKFLNNSPINLDILILDLNFPEGNSLKFIAKFKEKFSNLIIVIISAQSDIRIALQTLDLGANYYICKDDGFKSDFMKAMYSIIDNIKLINRNQMLKNGIFDPINYPAVLFQLSEFGLEASYKDFEEFPEPLPISIDEFLMNLGISFIMLLRRGDEYNEGCFTLPAGESEFFSTLLIAFQIPNPNAVDKRLLLGFYQLCLFIPKSFTSLFPLADDLSFLIKEIKNVIPDATHLVPEQIVLLKQRVLRLIKEFN